MKNRRTGTKPARTSDNEWFARLALGAAATGGLVQALPTLWMAAAGGAGLLALWVWGVERRLAYSERVLYRNVLIVILGVIIAVGMPLRQAQEQEREAAREAGR